jgi:hypothetical protein
MEPSTVLGFAVSRRSMSLGCPPPPGPPLRTRPPCGGGQGWGVERTAETKANTPLFPRGVGRRDPPPCSSPTRGGGDAGGRSARNLNRTGLLAIESHGLRRPRPSGPLPRSVDAREHDEQGEQRVEEFMRNFNHWTAPRPRAGTKRGSRSSPWRRPRRTSRKCAQSCAISHASH